MSQQTDDIDQLADRVIDQLEPGFYDGKLVLSRRQAIALTGTTFSAAALMGVGFGSAQAQEAAGQVGTDAEPIDVWAASINDGGPVSDGDGTERQIWVIANGAADPAGAGANDIIFEEEEA